MTTSTPPTAAPAVSDTPAGFAARAVPLVAGGFLLGGWIGAVAAAAAVASTFRRPATLAAGGAAALLVVAALATVIEVPVDDDALRSSFALDRPVAAAAGLAAAIFALVAVVTLAVRERAAAPAPAAAPSVPVARVSPAARARALAPLAPVAGIALVAAVALLVLAPSPPAATREVATSVRLGLGWGASVDDGLRVDGTEPPAAVLVAAVAPGGAGLWTAVAGGGAVALVAALARRLRGDRAALVAAGVTAVVLLVGRADLAGALAAVAVAAALGLGHPTERTVGRAAGAGALFGAACLCLPVAAVLLPLVVAALTVSPRTREVTVGHGAAALAAAVLVLAPWQLWVVDRFSTWAPAAELQLPLGAAVGLLAPLAAVGLAASGLTRRA